MYTPNRKRSLETLYKIFETEPRFDNVVLGTEYQDSDAVNVLFVRCAGSEVPEEVAKELDRSEFTYRTRHGVNSDTTIVHVREDSS